MPVHSSSSDAPNWRRGGHKSSLSPPYPAPAPVPVHREHLAHRKDKDRAQDNWRAHAQPITASTKPHHDTAARSQPMSISPSNGKRDAASSSSSKPSLLSTSRKRDKANMLDADWIPGQHPHPQPSAPHAIKPSSMGNGIIGRSPEFGTSPTNPKTNGFAAMRHHWPLSSSLEKSQSTGPAAHLHPLRIEHNEGSRFFPTSSTPHRPAHHTQNPQHLFQATSRLADADPNDNWMLTPTSSLPSIPSTPNRPREASTERSLAASNQPAEVAKASNLRTPLFTKGPVEQLQASSSDLARTPSPSHGHGFGRHETGFTGTSLFNRGPSVNVQSSPKRSPLVLANIPLRQGAGNGATNPALLSPTTSPKLTHRTLSPMTRHPPVIAEAHSNGDRMVSSIASMLGSPAAQGRPGPASRRESFTSTASAGAGHTMSHSRRSSAVLSPHSPTVQNRIGVYRPPHLRNRGSVSGLKPSVAHYDRVRTPSLRGLSRSRESSISLSRPSSRPPSTVPFYHTDSIPEDGPVAEDAARAPLRGRQSTMSIHLPGLIADQQQRNAAAAAAAASASDSDDGHTASFVPNTTSLLEQPLDSASLLAKLRAQLVRREAAASDAAASEADRLSVVTDDNEQDFFDLSDMMEYGASEGHPLSRYGSMYALEGRPLGDVFDVGDLLGPGMEHDGHVIQIAETTPGFVDQNEDLTGSKLEVVRKLGEGSYAVVYLVKEVSAEDAAVQVAQKTVAIPTSASRASATEANGRHPDDDADLTMVASSEDLLSTTLKANGKNKENGFHNSPALEERRRKDLRINTRLRPGKEFALKCLCKRDLPEDMLEVQRLEATIHQSIPSHPNIVTLYRTYETPDWLFLVLEYCPGQDLYYWLEQAQDTGQPSPTEGETDRDQATDDNYQRLGTSLDATPPSPSLLASTSGRGLLSKRRIRLISRMFRQICDSVQFCHDRGVSHRDIKPENFIVEDRRTIEEMQSACPDTSAGTLVESTRDGDDAQVIVKMTDFGLATAEDRCDDFDCGSKPYMAFECHNNISSSYDPKQADIWSLGVVLLNLLFHRSPFTEPSMNCPSFAAYCEDPIRFLMESFDGLTETVARFLSENVFCSVTDDDDVSEKRISAGEFSRWAMGLVDHMGLSGSGRGRISRGASLYSTIPLIHSRTGSMSTLPSLLSSPRPRARSLARDTDHIPDLDVAADATFRAAFGSARQGSLSPYPSLFTPDVLPSPTFTPSPQPPERNPFDTQYAAASNVTRTPETISESPEQQHDANLPFMEDSTQTMVEAAIQEDESTRPHDLITDNIEAEAALSMVDSDSKPASTAAETAAAQHLDGRGAAVASVDASLDQSQDAESGPGDGEVEVDAAEHDDAAEAGADADAPAAQDGDKAESITTSNHSKRRKRGARKGRTLAKQLKRSQSVEGMADVDANDPEAKARERERTIRELAMASESLARQMSKMAKPSEAADAAISPQIVLSRPTAETVARYSQQNLVDGAAEGSATARSVRPGEEAGVAGASAAPTNWSSAAVRRERMSEQRKTGGPLLQDSGRTRVMSWRERNPSVATFSSMASSVTTASSHSSVSSATSSIYSTASAPAALPRKDFSARNRTRGSGFGLDTISERERAAPSKKEVDAKYLAGIFGGGDNSKADAKRKTSSLAKSAEPTRTETNGTTVKANDAAMSNEARAARGGESGRVGADAGAGVDRVASASQPTQLRAGESNLGANGVRSVSVGSANSTSSASGVAASFVSRFRRPSSSSSANKAAGALEGGTALAATASTGSEGEKGSGRGAGMGMLRDASTSTSSLHTSSEARGQAAGASSAHGGGKPGITSKGSADATSVAEGAAAQAPKKRGMGKFLLGMRDSIKNF